MDMITVKQCELEAARRRSVIRVVLRVQECLRAGNSAVETDILERHPLAAIIHCVTLREGAAGRAVVETANEVLSERADRDAQRLREGRMIGLQCSLVLPARETRDAMLGLGAVEETMLEAALDKYASLVAGVLPKWWFQYVRIAASYTVVTINNFLAPPRFSGTYSDAFGAVHGALPTDIETYVEVLTHEAGHLWLNLLADQDTAFIRNSYTDRRFVSPWRNDARPIHGILHGAYVFSIVVPALLAMRTEKARSRAVKLAVEVRDAVSQVLAYGSLSGDAHDIAVSAEARVKNLEQDLGKGALASANEQFALEKKRKVARLKEMNPELQVVGGPE